MIDPGNRALGIIFGKVCVLVTAAFTLTLVPGLRRSERSLLSFRDRGTALLVFLLLGLVEEASVGRTGWFNHRIVAVCVAGLLAGPGVGAIVSGFVTWLAVTYDGRPLGPIMVSMTAAGLIGGLIYRWRPDIARRPSTGFYLASGVSLLRDGLSFLYTPDATALRTLGQLTVAPILQGAGAALILAIVAQVRALDEQTRATAIAEVRALQARMNPHFLFNALNALAGLAAVAPREIPRATGWLRQFLRASFDQHDRTLVPLAQELAVVRAYLKIESLRLGSRLKVEEAIDPGLVEFLTPPFTFQPLVENAVQHGIQSSSEAGQLRLVVRSVGQWLEMSVGDDGKGVTAGEIEQIFFATGPEAHALVLLRRRLEEQFGNRFRLDVSSQVGKGTTVTLRIPLQTEPEVAGRSLEDVATECFESGHFRPTAGHRVSSASGLSEH